MKILAPLSSINELKDLIPLGANEFYFGISSTKNMTELDSLNFRPDNTSNLNNINDVKLAAKIIHQANLKCFLTLNSDLCTQEAFNSSISILEDVYPEIDGAIISNIAFIEEAVKRFPQLEIITSTRCHSFNSWNINFFKELGVKRFTLPHHFYFSDITKLLERFPETNFDIFVKNEGCVYINGICSYFHNLDTPKINLDRPSFCKALREHGQFYLIDNNKSIPSVSKQFATKKYKNTVNFECKICWMHHLSKYTDRIIVKITGRGNNLKRKIIDLTFVKRSLEFLKEGKSGIKKIQSLHEDTYNCHCSFKCGYQS